MPRVFEQDGTQPIRRHAIGQKPMAASDFGNAIKVWKLKLG
jgi:hypothetical protein